MHSTLKRMGCFALVLVLMFMIFAQPLAPKAEASAIAISASAMASILQFLALCGITFLTYKAAEAAVNAFVEVNPDIMAPGLMKDFLEGEFESGGMPPESPPPDPSARWKYLQLCAASGGFVADLINRIVGFFGNKKDISIPDPSFYKFGNYPLMRDSPSMTHQQRYDASIISYQNNTLPTANRSEALGRSQFVVDGVPYYYFFENNGNLSYQLKVRIGNEIRSSNIFANIPSGIRSLVDLRIGFESVSQTGSIRVHPNVSFLYIDTNGNRIYSSVRQNDFVTSFVLYPESLVLGSKNITYKNKSAYTIPSIKQGIINRVNASPGPIVIDKTQVIEAIETESDEKLQESLDQDKLINMIPGLRDLLERIEENTKPSEEADFIPPELPGGELSEKFPFCVPFDLFRIVKALNAPPVAPRWAIPLYFSSIDYEDEVVLDLSEYETLAVPIRWGLTIIFLLGLIVVSRKMIKG